MGWILHSLYTVFDGVGGVYTYVVLRGGRGAGWWRREDEVHNLYFSTNRR